MKIYHKCQVLNWGLTHYGNKITHNYNNIIIIISAGIAKLIVVIKTKWVVPKIIIIVDNIT